MRKLISVILALFLSQVTILAQSPVAQSDATKPVQPAQSVADTAAPTEPRNRELKIPAGTPLEIEAVYTISSIDVRAGDMLSFHVLIPVKVEGVTVVEKYSLVTGRVVQSKRGGHWGKAGKLSWIMQDVVAVDLTRVPLQAQKNLPASQDAVRGSSHGGEVAAKTIVFGALLFPMSPLALMSGFKRGENAILPQGKRFVVFVQTDTVVKAPTDR